MEYKKKLIEVALPLEAINAESAREKSIRHGHPSTLHLWWARRPLAAARAVIFASLVDDPSAHPDRFKTEEEQAVERKRLFGIIERLVKWENTNNEEVLNEAKAEIMKSTNGNPPALLDPFAGGGTIPLEAQRLGLEAYASDLNPVAVMINKAMIEIPPKFAGQPPVNPESRSKIGVKWRGAQGLAEDVRYYGEWMKQKAFKRIGHLYPKVKDEHGQEHTVIAWIWARTVKCPNPACGCEMPLTNTFELSKKPGKETFISPIIEGNTVRFAVNYGKEAPKGTIIKRKGARCICCDTPVDFNYIRNMAKQGNMHSQLMAIVSEGKGTRIYSSPNKIHIDAAKCDAPENAPHSDIPEKALGINIKAYGFKEHRDLFTNRQLVSLTTLTELIKEVKARIISDGGCSDYANAVAVYLSFAIDKLSIYSNSICTWLNQPKNEIVGNSFGRQAIPIVWDYAEANPFSSAGGTLTNQIEYIYKAILMLNNVDVIAGKAFQADARNDNGLRNIMVSTDPPYYDNIGYADLSDFFYVWLRKSLRDVYPELFNTMLVPKVEELVANPFKFDGNRDCAREFFETGMLSTFRQIYQYSRIDLPLTVYYAFKQSEEDDKENTASTGWETMLTAIIESNFTITGTWPMRTERPGRLRDFSSNALASSIVLVCRKRPADAPICTRRDFINMLKRELKPAMQKLQASNIAPVDLAQSAIGPGMSVYSRFSKVLEADGKPMNVRSALQIINQELDLYFTEQDDELDRDSRFCVDLYTQFAFNDIKFGDADVLARAKNTSVEKLSSRGALYAQKGIVRLLTREEIPERIDKETIWLLTQQLTRAMEKDGVVGAAKIVADIFTSEPEHAKALAYRLYTIAERKGWASEAYAYNSLVIAWPDVQSKAAELKSDFGNSVQLTLDDIKNNCWGDNNG